MTMIALAMLLLAAEAPDPVSTALTLGCDPWLGHRPAAQALADAGWSKLGPAMFGMDDATASTTVTLEAPAGIAGVHVCRVTWRAKQTPVMLAAPLAAARGWLHRSFPAAARTSGDLFLVNGVSMTRETWQTDQQMVLLAVAQSHPDKGMDLLVQAVSE